MIRLDGSQFIDEDGRTVMLRGINLGGSSKNPVKPNGDSHRIEGFYDHRNVSFVGRPFPFAEADEHFTRLKKWGFNFIRLVVTWEALEHTGPGIYDEHYINYLAEIIKIAGDYGFYVAVDPHQDCWSRFSGGDGAPGWTLEALGMDITRISATWSAVLHNHNVNSMSPNIWPTNYHRFACATMFTVFFAGNDFSPKTMIDGEPAQEYLQKHFINSFKFLALRISHLPNLLGFDTLNEPSPGYIGWDKLENPHEILRIGPTPSPLQSMACASGYPQKVGSWKVSVFGLLRYGRSILNQEKTTLWKPGYACIWKEHGVWDIDQNDQPALNKKDYFCYHNERKVDFWKDYFTPFIQDFSREIRSILPDAIIFLGISPQQKNPGIINRSIGNVVNATHWYDTATLVTKRYMHLISIDYRTIRLVVGASRIRNMFILQLNEIKQWGDRSAQGAVPTLVGEFGIPFDLANKYAYRTGDFSQQEQALDAYFSAMEANLLNCALWSYSTDNNNLFGDNWYEEDFSIFSRDQQSSLMDIHSGGRALRAIVRPYPLKTPGEPLGISFNIKSKIFRFKFRANPAVFAPAEIFCPEYQYPSGMIIQVSDGSYEHDREAQVVRYYPSREREIHHITICHDPLECQPKE